MLICQSTELAVLERVYCESCFLQTITLHTSPVVADNTGGIGGWCIPTTHSVLMQCMQECRSFLLSKLLSTLLHYMYMDHKSE